MRHAALMRDAYFADFELHLFIYLPMPLDAADSLLFS